MSTNLFAVFIVAVAMSHTPTVAAQVAPDNPPRAPGYDSLDPLVGRWTIKGSEDTFVEVCRWFSGELHIVCDSEQKRPDDSTGKGMSILSYVQDQGYVYYGIDSKGRNQPLQRGTFQDGVLEYRSTASDSGKSTVTRVRIGPFAGREVPYVVDTSAGDGAWTVVHSVTYVKLD